MRPISLALLIAFLLGFFCETRWKLHSSVQDAAVWNQYQMVMASLGLGGNDLNSCNPNSKPSPPALWRYEGPSVVFQTREPFHWPSRLYLHLFSCALICVSMWFYNLHLKCFGFCWSTWNTATRKLIPLFHTSHDVFDRDNPLAPASLKSKSTSFGLKPRPANGMQRWLPALAVLSTMFQSSHMLQLHSEVQLRQDLRRYRNNLGGLDTHRLRPQHMAALKSKLVADGSLFSAVTKDHPDIAASIVDTGSSFSLTNQKSLFVPGSITKLDQPIHLDGITGDCEIWYKGRAKLETVPASGVPHTFETEMYYDPEFSCTLLSPQSILRCALKDKYNLTDKDLTDGQLDHITDQLMDDHFRVYANRMEWHVNGNLVQTMPYDTSFLPRLTVFPAGKAETSMKALLNSLHNSNRNLTPLQKLWQLWHVKLGHPAHSIVQRLGAAGNLSRHAMELSKLPPSDRPMCEACRYGKQVRTHDGTTVTSRVKDTVGALKCDQTVPGMRIFSDQAYSAVPGRRFHTAGREAPHDKFCGTTLFVDAASNYIHAVHQVTFNASDTINAKVEFERHCADLGVQVDSYHTDNGVYKSQAFTEELARNSQSIRFSGVGAHFQNGVAEGAIRIVVTKARTMILHAEIMWPEVKDPSLWPMALTHATHMYNHTPNTVGLAPVEVFSRTVSDHQALRLAHTWGCPTYVLEPRLTTAGGKIPKWQPRSRRAQYMGTSPVHAESVALVRNLHTGYLSPQFHVVFDDKFETVYADENDPPPEWDRLCVLERFETPFDPGDTPPPLSDEWLSPDELALRRNKGGTPAVKQGRDLYEQMHTRELKEDFDFEPPPPEPLALPPPRKPPDKLPNHPNKESAPSTSRAFGNWKRKFPTPKPPSNPSPPSNPVPPPVRRNPSRKARHKPIQLLQPTFSGKTYDSPKPKRYKSVLAAALALSNPMTPHTNYLLHDRISNFDPDTNVVLDAHPGVLQSPFMLKHPLGPAAFKAKKKVKDPDLPSLKESLNSPQAEEWWKAMDKEIESLEAKGTWTVIDRSDVPDGCSVIPATWVQRLKRHPDGSLNKHKSRLCVRGDIMRQHFNGPSYSPLVGWPTIRAGLLLAATHGWKSRQVDFTLAFCQSPQKSPVYMELPQYYRPKGCSDRDVVLQLNKSLYGQVDSPLLFYEHLTKGMKALGFEPADSDPCLFIHRSKQIMVLNYCDDQIWLSPDNALIEEYVHKLQNLGYDLTLENDNNMFGFLGIEFSRTGDTIELTQKGLIQKVLDYTGMASASPMPTPAAREPLGRDLNGLPMQEEWSYPAVIGMLLYISSNSRPDIQFAVHQAARFTHSPRQSHAQAVKRILRYLNGTKLRGTQFTPDLNAGLDCFVDADFAGLWGYEDDQDPVSVKSRTGFTLTLFGCPIIWSSKLQVDITLSSTAAEYVAFSAAMRELLPMRALLKEMSRKLGLKLLNTSLVRSTVFEDNQGCLSLVNVPKMSTKNKYLGLKYHFFRSHIGPKHGIEARYISTLEQKADIFTKGLPAAQFQHIRKLLIGW